MYGLEELAAQRRQELETAIEEARNAKSDDEALGLLLEAIDKVRESMASFAVESVSVDNLDEVQAALRNELNRISKPIIKALESLKLPSDEIAKIKSEVDRKNVLVLDENYDLQITRRPKQRLQIENLSDIRFPSSVSVNNLQELKKFFESLSSVIQQTFNVPSPQVTVNPPEIIVNVPELRIPEIIVPEMHMPEMKMPDFSGFQEAIKNLKDAIRRTSSKQVTAFSQGLNSADLKKYLKANSTIGQGIGDGRQTVTTPGTRVQLSATSVVCKKIDIVAELDNTDVVVVGGSTCVAALATRRGVPLMPGDVLTVEISNLNLIYIDAVIATEGVTYAYTN